jgi:hydrogenase/urease accessory protein HupE
MQAESETKTASQTKDVAISVVVVTMCSMLGMLAGYAMGANDQEREWAMLYGVAFIGSMSSFFCLIKLSQVVRMLGQGLEKKQEITK